MGEPSAPVYGPPAFATGLAFASVRLTVCELVAPSSSVTVNVTVNAPSSVHVMLAVAWLPLVMVQVVPASAVTTVWDQAYVLIVPSGSEDRLPFSETGKPSVPLLFPPA